MGKFTPKAGFDGKSINGTVVSSNKNGAILRGRGVPIVKQNKITSESKNNLSSIASSWSASPQSVKDSFNNTTFLGNSGYALYVWCAMIRAAADEPPRPFPPSQRPYIPLTAVAIRNATYPLALQLTAGGSGARYGVAVYMTPLIPVDAGFITESSYRLVYFQKGIATELVDLEQIFLDNFGSLVGGGAYRVAMKVVEVNWFYCSYYTPIFTGVAIG